MPKSASISGADRYNFMMALTGYLISNRQQPIQKVADHFGVSVDELRKALVTISLSGVGRYRPDELFFLDYDLLEEGIVDLSFAPTLESAPRLSARQAAAIASGLSSLGALLDEPERGEITELLDILASGSIGNGELPVSIQPEQPDRELIAIRNAIELGKVISCEYRNISGEVKIREIEPWFLESKDNDWYLRGWCGENSEPRVFRVDRMRDVALLDREISHFPSGTSGELYSGRDSDVEVLFEVEPEAFGFIADFKPEEEISGYESVRVKIRIGNLENLGRVVCRYGGKVQVIEPKVAREKVREFALAALNKDSQLGQVE